MIFKIIRKFNRVFCGLKKLLCLGKLKKVSIQKVVYKSPRTIFNIGSYYDGKNFISIGREYFKDVRYLGPADFYIAISKNALNLNFQKIDTSLLKKNIKNFKRLEDGRPFLLNGKIHCICACICVDLKNEISSKQIIIVINISKVESFKVFNTKNRFEKNWSLYDKNNLSFVYSLKPFQKKSFANLTSQENCISFNNADFSFRNNSNFIDIDSYKFSIGHQIIDLGIYYAYLHFFIKIDDKSNVFISESFYFNELNNEFVLTINEDNNKNILINFSNHDLGNFIAKYKIDNLTALNWQLIND